MTKYSNFFFLHSFLASTIYKKTHLKTNLVYGSVGFFEIQAFEQTVYFQF